MQSDNNQSAGMLEINVVEKSDCAVVFLAGRFDIDSSPVLRDRLLAMLKSRGQQRVSVDLSAVTNVDSSAIATLIEALKIAHAYRIELMLQGLHDELLRLFEFTGILYLFNGRSETRTHSGNEVV